jgi:hypothetical protein
MSKSANFVVCITELHLERTLAEAAPIRAGKETARASVSARAWQGRARAAAPFLAGRGAARAVSKFRAGQGRARLAVTLFLFRARPKRNPPKKWNADFTSAYQGEGDPPEV